MATGIWQKQSGFALAPSAPTTKPAQPNVLYETGAVILTPNGDGKIFRMWYDLTTGTNNAANGIGYAESNDGKTYTAYASNPVFSPMLGIITSPDGDTFSKMTKVGSTYYYNVGPLGGPVQVWTSSDGITWAQQNATALSVGTTGAWDSVRLCLLKVAAVVSGTWYAYYAGAIDENATGWSAGLATSSDGIHWTKSLSNPIIGAIDGILPAPSFEFAQINGIYYGWTQIATLVPGGNKQLPCDFMRYSASNPAGPWALHEVLTFYRSKIGVTAPDGVNRPYGVGDTSFGQVADPSIVSALGNLYLYYTVNSGPSPAGISCAIASSTTFAQLIQTNEGVVDVPTPQNLSLDLHQLASDPFSGVDANPIGGNWSQLSTQSNFEAAQLVGHQYTGTATAKGAASYWNALTWPADQWSQVTVNTCAANSFVGLALRQNTAGVGTGYFCLFKGTLGTLGEFHIYKAVNNAFTELASGSTLLLNANDVLTASIIGTTISFYQNGNLVATTVDSAIATGAAGIYVQPITSVANAAVSAWSGGSIAQSIGGNAGIAGATVSYSGAASGSVTADAYGTYVIPSLIAGAYTITPSFTGYSFSPASASETVSGADITGVDFTATQTLVATPTFSPVAGSYGSTQNVTISSTDSGLTGFAITYTTDGSTPVPSSHGTVYSGVITVSITQTIKAVASATSYANSVEADALYTINSSSGYSSTSGLQFSNMLNWLRQI